MMRILHVSDVHFGVSDPNNEQVRITDALIKAVKDARLDPDVVIFSGDLAFSGLGPQFASGQTWLQRLCQVVPQADLLLVPGNHDVARSKVVGRHYLHAASTSEESYLDWKKQLNGGNPPHLEDFADWTATAGAVLPLKANWSSPFGFHYTKTGLSRPLHVIGLNSALLSCDNADEKHLVVDVATLNKALYDCRQAPGFVVAVVHHPLDFLVDWNQRAVDQILSQQTGADILLHGHLHAQIGVAKSEISGRGLVTCAAGATYQGSRWPQQFAMYTIDFDQREMRTVAYTYSADAGQWIPDNSLSYSVPLDIDVIDPDPGDTDESEVAEPPQPPKPLQGGAAGAAAVASDEADHDEDRPAGMTADSTREDLEIKDEIHRYRTAARYVAERVDGYFRASPVLKNVCYHTKHRVKNRARLHQKMRDKRIRSASKIVDICGFRLITFFQGDIPLVVEHILKVIELEEMPKSPFSKGSLIEIDINTSRTESDPLSISKAVQDVARRSPLAPVVVVRSRETGYSSVHMVVRAPAFGEDSEVDEMPLEIQIRSAWEDIWGEIDHRLRYGFERGGLGVSSGQHLNVFKALIDGVVQYGDVIRRQSEDDNLKSPNSIKAERTIAAPELQLHRLRGLRADILQRVEKAYEIWKQADASRQRGGDPGLLRQAADAFTDILREFKGQPADSPALAAELEYLATTESAYMLMYTGDPYDEAQSAELYESILQQRPEDATALFRLGTVRGRQKQLQESDRLLTKALQMIESGKDDRLGVNHWTYDIARLGLALTKWRSFTEGSPRDNLTAAIDLAKRVVEKPVDSTHLARAINDLLYYAWEERQRRDPAIGLKISDAEFNQLTEKLERELQVQERTYEYYDTLTAALSQVGRADQARQAALKLRDMLEQVVVLRVPELNLGKKGSYAWTFALSRYLDDNQKECLARAQDVIALREN